MPELVALLLVALGLLGAIVTAIIVWEATHPPRRTAGWALAHGRATDPGDLGLSFESWTLDRAGGVTLPVWEITIGSAEHPTVVLVHGWGQSRLRSLERVDPWRALASRLVLYDLRGHGDAGGTSRLGHKEEDDLLALLDRLGDGPFILDGYSMGAEIAIHAAAAERDTGRIAGVVASGAYRTVHVPLRNRLAAIRHPARPVTDIALVVLRLVGIRQRDVAIAARRLQCPLLVVHGADDHITPIDGARAIAEAAAKGTFVEVPDRGHGDGHLAEVETSDDLLRDFLGGPMPQSPAPDTPLAS